MENRLTWIVIIFFTLFFLQFAEYAFEIGEEPLSEENELLEGEFLGNDAIYIYQDADGTVYYGIEAKLIETEREVVEQGALPPSPYSRATAYAIVEDEVGSENMNSVGFVDGIFDVFVLEVPDSPLIITIILSSINAFLIFLFAYITFSFAYDIIKALPLT